MTARDLSAIAKWTKAETSVFSAAADTPDKRKNNQNFPAKYAKLRKKGTFPAIFPAQSAEKIAGRLFGFFYSYF